MKWIGIFYKILKYLHIIQFLGYLKLVSIILDKHSIIYLDDNYLVRIFVGNYGGVSVLINNYYFNYSTSLQYCNYKKVLRYKNINLTKSAIDIKLKRVLSLTLLESILLEDALIQNQSIQIPLPSSQFQIVSVKNSNSIGNKILYKTGNYFHFYIETITQILMNMGKSVDIYFMIGKQPFYQAILNFYNIPYSYDDIIPTRNNDFDIPRIYPFSKDIIWLFNYNKKYSELDSDKTYRLYITRQYESQRRVKNEDTLIALLSKYGFIVIDPGKIDFKDQARYFRNAEIIIAPHGAALSNIVWCENTVKIIELNGSVDVRWHFAKIAIYLRFSYLLLLGNTIDEKYFETDIHVVEKLLRQAILSESI